MRTTIKSLEKFATLEAAITISNLRKKNFNKC